MTKRLRFVGSSAYLLIGYLTNATKTSNLTVFYEWYEDNYAI